MINTCVNDIYDTDNKDIIIVDLEVWNDKEELVDTYDIELDLSKMGIDSEDDYMFTLSKDLDRFVRRFYSEKGFTPSIETIKKEMEGRNYISIEL